MDKTMDRNTQDGVPDVLSSADNDKPRVEPYDPYFGRHLFERSESFFRRYETPDRLEEEVA